MLGLKTTLLVLLFGLAGTAIAADATRRDTEERAVARVADALDHAVDTKDWTAARAAFADRVVIDMASLDGPAGVELAADDIVAGWRRAFQGGKTSLHLRTNHLARINGDNATLSSHGYAWNRLPAGVLDGHDGPVLWEVWGVYDYRLRRDGDAWRITHFRFVARHERGPRAVATTFLPD